MSTSIHASIEYELKISPGNVMSFAEVAPGVSFSDIFGALGVRGGGRSAVPKRGYPKDGEYIASMGWVAERDLTVLVDRLGHERERSQDGLCITEAEAEEYMTKYGCKPLPEAHAWSGVGGGNPASRWYRITQPDIHSVNWITADELEKAIEAAGNGYLHGYRAALAAMRVLEADEHVTKVRFVYGFDN